MSSRCQRRERLRSDHKRGPPVPGERLARRGQERPVAVFEVRAPDAAVEHLDLVTEHRFSSWSCDTLVFPVSNPTRRTRME
jgi:hypothetical protein